RGDREQPRPERPAPIVAAAEPVDAEPGLLVRLLGRRPRSGPPDEEPEDRVAPTRVELLVGRAIVADHPAHQLLVRHVTRLVHQPGLLPELQECHRSPRDGARFRVRRRPDPECGSPGRSRTALDPPCGSPGRPRMSLDPPVWVSMALPDGSG